MKLKSFATTAVVVCGLLMMGPASATLAQGRGVTAPVVHADADGATCPSSNAPPGTGSQISAADEAALVSGHNSARQQAILKYNPGLTMVPVTWDAKLACDAQAWADDPASSAGGGLHHSDRSVNGNEGENLLNSTGPVRPMIALDPSVNYSWISEQSKFDADKNAAVNGSAAPGTNFHAWGHYSQMVWMSPASATTAIGCGIKQDVPVDGGTGWILVCRYRAAGNIDGQQAIPPGTGGGPVVPPKQPKPPFPAGVGVAMANQADNLLTALAVDKDGYLNVAWVVGTQPWHDPVRFGPPAFQPGAPVAMAKQADNLLTALAVDKDGYLNVAWVVGTQPWHDPVRFGPPVFQPGAPVSVAMAKQESNLLTALAVDKDGYLNVAWVVGTQPWHDPVRFGPPAFQPGAPVAMANQADNLLTALAVDKDGYLNVAWVVGTQPWHDPVRFGPPVFQPGAPVSVAMAKQESNLLTALAVDKDGYLNVAWVVGTQPWHDPVRFGPPAFQSGAPVAMANQADNLLTALAVDKDGYLNVAWVVGTQPWHDPVRFGPSVFQPGARVSVAMAKQESNLLTALAVDKGGYLNVAWVVGTQPWHDPVRFGPPNFPASQ
ncbi:CAP domain-containing protein [Streptomyces sp. FH025]|uniref:CAP domain-containing protein n=1 Tax=Streptomyces sp. FH025 TaxID=2815937 RepID=UPI001A9D0F87|nr:CAP domain-containing protein [Streptomyces sp. FH025]MBO1416242.1 hypothetical protein [Streptomyces sp. FH025]